MVLLRSLVFTSALFLSVIAYSIPVALSLLLPHRVAYAMTRSWARLALWMLEHICGLRYRVEGLGQLPDAPCVMLLKHQSAWETIAQIHLFPPQTWVLKRELMWVPFLGWGLRALRPIAIDRRAGHTALEQVVQQGRQRLEEGLWVMIFPEGTRVAVGRTGRYGRSGAALACAAGVPVVPVAHNAGEFWPRRSLLKLPGVVQMRVGPPIATQGRDVQQVTDEARAWIEATMQTLTRRS